MTASPNSGIDEAFGAGYDAVIVGATVPSKRVLLHLRVWPNGVQYHVTALKYRGFDVAPSQSHTSGEGYSAEGIVGEVEQYLVEDAATAFGAVVVARENVTLELHYLVFEDPENIAAAAWQALAPPAQGGPGELKVTGKIPVPDDDGAGAPDGLGGNA